MKIQAIRNYTYNNNCQFSSAKAPHYTINKAPDNQQKEPENKPLPEWARKGMLAALLFFAFKNDPYVQNLMKPESIEREEKARQEYFEDAAKLTEREELVPATYHLNRLADVDNIKIQNSGMDDYKLTIPLDKDTISTQISLSPISQNALTGSIKDKNGENIRYKAVFSDKNPDVFEIQMRNKDNDTYTFGRTPKGEFYRLENNKKVILNKKNVEKYQKSLENLPNFEEINDLKFFTNENDMWRKLNIILITFLLLAEMAHDNARRKGKKD